VGFPLTPSKQEFATSEKGAMVHFAVPKSRAAHVSCGSWLCENSSARRARRKISKKLRIMESNRAPRTMFDTLLENFLHFVIV
jgi:hypothetical protein